MNIDPDIPSTEVTAIIDAALRKFYPPCPKGDGIHWLMFVPVISTAHITKADADILTESACDYEEGFIVNIAKTIYDPIGAAGEQLPAPVGCRLSPECNSLLKAFSDLGYMWVRFDRDGDVLEGVSTFGW